VASGWLVAWLAIGQVLPLGPTTAVASEPASGQWVERRVPQTASDGRLSLTSEEWQPPNERVPFSSTSKVSQLQEDVAALLAKYDSEQQNDVVDVAWIADATSPASGEELPPVEDTNQQQGKVTDQQRENDRKEQSGQRSIRPDPELVRQGQSFFESACTQCHDAERATNKRKTLAGWLATVRRMAAKEDADVPTDQHTAIATYLASLNPAYESAEEGEADAELATAEADVPPFTLNGTLSPVWRGTDPEVENKGFFPDVWVGIEWRPPNSPVSGKVTACASCHGTNDGLGVELVEAAAILDLCHLCTRKPAAERPHCRTAAELTMGRFIVPFGAFSGRVHPGALRTVSLPLMYNMGRRVGPIGPGQPVINQPYSDEGANLHLEYDLHRDWDVTFDTYAVNGLQFGGPGVFFFSRSYQDNNSNVAVGGRATIGNERWRFGGSIAGGELQDDGAPLQTYSLAGGDVSYRHGEHFRTYYEYAIREEDSFSFPNSESIAYGNLIESEVLLLKEPKISFLARYDTLEHRGTLGHMSTERFTYGLNWLLPGGSLLILNHEHWMYDNRSPANIFGLRWTTAF
jgi:mono/diheme cytochrome c family protein